MCEREEFVTCVKTQTRGRGVFARKDFAKGDFIVEYCGEVLGAKQAKLRKNMYDRDPAKYGSFVYDIKFRGEPCSIDATHESHLLGRVVNHSHNRWNCAGKVFDIDNKPRLILIASKKINKGDEIVYDYADRSKENIEANTWLIESA